MRFIFKVYHQVSKLWINNLIMHTVYSIMENSIRKKISLIIWISAHRTPYARLFDHGKIQWLDHQTPSAFLPATMLKRYQFQCLLPRVTLWIFFPSLIAKKMWSLRPISQKPENRLCWGNRKWEGWSSQNIETLSTQIWKEETKTELAKFPSFSDTPEISPSWSSFIIKKLFLLFLRMIKFPFQSQ